MTLIKVAVWLLVQLLLLRGSKQQACPPEPCNLACSAPGGGCALEFDFTGLQGKTIVLTEPGIYRFNGTAQLSEDSVVTCINGSTPDTGSYILEILDPGDLHFAITGTGASLVLQSLTVRGNTYGLFSGGISMSSSSNLILSSVLYQSNSQPITTTGPGAKLTITDTRFINNNNRMGPGGAIFASEDSGVAMTTITFNGNNSFDSNAATTGGAICIKNNVLVNQPTRGSMTFSRNKARCADTGCGGGAICINQTKPDTQPQVNLSNAEFVENTATRGGAVLVAGGKMTIQSKISVVFSGNSADSSGGAICVQGFAGTSYQGLLPDPVLIVSGATMISNKVLDPSTGPADNGSGGAVYASANTSVMLASLTFMSNTASRGGAIATQGVLLIDKCRFYANVVPANGGAILGATNAIITVRECFFTDNRAAMGGAIATDAATLYLQAVAAATAFSKNSASSTGGALYVTKSFVNTTSAIGSISFDYNRAGTLGGAIFSQGSTVFLGDALAKVAVFSNNVGGAIAAVDGGELHINNVWFYQNNASDGGALYLLGTKANIYQARFERNQATSGNGGAIWASPTDNTTALHIGDVNKPGWRTFMNDNSAKGYGGAVYLVEPWNSDMAAVCFIRNTAGVQLGGGAIRVVGPYDISTQLLLLNGLQSFGGNTAAGASNALSADLATVACAKDAGDGNPVNVTIIAVDSAYNIEGFICSNYASIPTVNTCPAGAQNCTCPANTTFDAFQCACSAPPPPPPGLAVSITGLPPTADVGAVVTATLTVAGSGPTGAVVSNVRLTVDIPLGLTASGLVLPAGCSLIQDSSSPVAVVTCVIGNVTVGGSPYTAALQLTANQAGTAELTANTTGTGVGSVGTQASVMVLGACCNADQGGTCSYTATASNCSALNPVNTFFDTSNCSTACAEPPEAISLDLLRTARSPKTAEVGRDVRVLMVVTAPKASAVNVTATLVIPNNLKFLSINPPDCMYEQQIITCQPFHALHEGRSRQFVIATTSLSAGNATISATVSRPGGEVEGQSSLTIPILGGCCNNQSSTPCSATTARDCKKAGGKFYKTKSCRALKKACSIDKAGG